MQFDVLAGGKGGDLLVGGIADRLELADGLSEQVGETGAGVELVSRSQLARAEKRLHSLAASFGETRAGIVSLHSKRALGSKCTHWMQACNAVWHFSHLLSARISLSTGVPQRAHFATAR